MSTAYLHPKPGPAQSASALGLALLFVLAAFALLPFLTTFPKWLVVDPPTPVTPAEDIIPPRPVDPPKVDPQTIEPIDKPILKPKLPPVDISLMERLINAGDSGVGIAVDWGESFTASAGEIGVFLEKDVDVRPKVLVAVQPLYPYSLRGQPGEVVLEFVIAANGQVKRPIVKKSSHYAFEQPAIDAVRKSKWQPGQVDGKPVDTLVRLPIRFTP